MAGSAARREKLAKGKKRKATSSSEDALNLSIVSRRRHEREEDEGCGLEARETPATAIMEIEEETKEESKGSCQWRNLDIALSIENKKLDALKKLELVFEFVNSRAKKEDNNVEQDFNVLSMSRLLSDISKWIQLLLITSEKKLRGGDKSEEATLYLDYRCWDVFKYCLEESLRLQVSLRLNRDLLMVISCVARSALKSFSSVHIDASEPIFSTIELRYYNTVCDCIKLIFSSHGRLLEENLDSWAVAVSSTLELAVKIYGDIVLDHDARNLFSQLSCLVFEPFSKFLKVNPVRKDRFRDFVDRLLEPLLQLLGMLHDKVKNGLVLEQSLYKLVQEIFSYGLFHSVHLDEYLSINSTEKYKASTDCNLEDVRTIIKSYHRHLFEKLEYLISERKARAVAGIGDMFQLFINCVRKFKRDSLDAENSKFKESKSIKHPSKIGNLTSEKSDYMDAFTSELRKSVLDFFVVSLEPLLADLKKSLQSDLQAEGSLLDIYHVLKSVNKIISVLVHERVYLRTEGDFGGACLNFFKIVYGLLLSCYAKFNQLWQSTLCGNRSAHAEILNCIAKEFNLVVGNFLEIEYEVIGDDLVSTWVMILNLLGMAHFSDDATLSLETVDLGCQVLNLYSELRQVNHAVFALCKGLRHLSSYQGDGETNYFEHSTANLILHQGIFAKSGLVLLCCRKFRMAICTAITSIPEGQASGCVQALADDISYSLMWMKSGSSVADKDDIRDINSQKFSVQGEIFGLVLSEIYSLVLESLSVSAGNSYLMGVSLKKLIMVLQPSMNHLVASEQIGADEFLFSVIGISFTNKMECQNDLQDKFPLVLLFFFRLYATSRSIFRQALSLMPPDSSRTLSGGMADLYMAYSGQDFMEKTDFEDEGYFSWIVRPSASLMSVMQFTRDKFLQKAGLDHSCLIYVMHIMTFQRLADLNRQIQSLRYVMHRNKNVINSKQLDDAELLMLREKKKKQKIFLSSLNREAADLTGFIMEHLPLVDEKLPSELCGRPANDSSPQRIEVAPWDLGVCTVNEKTLPAAIWWTVCQNIDIWSNHASKKNLKLFLSLLVLNSSPYGKCGVIVKHPPVSAVEAMKVTKLQISQELLHDTTLFDQRFVCRYIASQLCDSLKNYASLLFKDLADIDAELSLSDWRSILSVLLNLSKAARDKSASSYCTCNDQIGEACKKQASSSQISLHVAASRSLLDLLCQTMEKSLSLDSLSSCVTYLVNFERLVIGSLLDPHGTMCLHEHHEFLGLLVACRRALKYLLMASCEAKSEASISPIAVWLLQSLSLVATWCNSLSSEKNASRRSNMIFSLMDHTSYVFFTLCKYQFGSTVRSIMRPKGAKVACVDCGGGPSNKCTCMRSSKDTEACESLSSVVETFKEQIESFPVSLKEASTDDTVEVSKRLEDMNILSSVVSCIQGFLSGLESTLDDLCANMSELKAKITKRKHRTISNIKDMMIKFVRFIGEFLQMFLHSDRPLKSPYKNSRPKNSSLGPSNVQNNTSTSGSKKALESEDGVIGVPKFGSFTHNLRVDLLQSCLDGENLEVAFFLRGLFAASSAIVKLSMWMGDSLLPSDLIQILMGCSEVLLKKYSCMDDKPNPLSFLWLDGTLKFLETFGGQVLSTSPEVARETYTKLVELHLKAIGKCICLQGKGATPSSHDIESSTKAFSQKKVSDPVYGLDELKTRLRMSFKILIENSSEEHLLAIVQDLERVLVGAREDCTAIYELRRESTEGGMVSSVVAAGVDGLDLVLEFVKGKRQMDLVRSCINNLIASLFNIIVHLQGFTLFYESPNIMTVNMNPDSGSVALMCVEVLTRIAAKPALIHLGSNYVGQSTRIPAMLFQGFCNLRAKKSSCPSLLKPLHSKECEDLESCFLVDSQFAINLYAASCRLLWTIVKHHKSESVRCIGLLQISLQSLLHCLEVVDTNSAVRNDYFSWQVEEGVKCASYLRRVYEEIRQQRDVLGWQCFMFLSDYIWLYSGLGPLKQGIKREVDEALRPGVYALIDVCSPDELQYLHTVFGEGPCRSTLASLQHDYKLHFQYEGKV